MKNYLLILTAVFLAACATSNTGTNSTSSTSGNANEIETNDEANLPLDAYLRRVPGLMVQGSGANVKILVRGATTSSGSTTPLFVIDRVPIGNDYSQVADQVDVASIKTVRVLKDASETASYGSRGANGVIMITTKKK